MTTDWQSDLRKRGYRLTPQRQLVLEAVDKLEHATPDEILTEVRRTAGSVNISTVYRTLELLEELGLVSHAHLGHGAPTYHLADRHHHLHLVCRDCSEVIEADLSVADAFTAQLRESFGFDTDMKHFAIFGRCAACSAEAAGAAGEAGDTAGGPAAEPGDRTDGRTAPDARTGTTARSAAHRGADAREAGP